MAKFYEIVLNVRKKISTSQIKPPISWIIQDKKFCVLTAISFTLSLALAIFCSVLVGILFLLAYICGCSCYHLLRIVKHDRIGDLFLFLLPKQDTKISNLVLLNCAVCGKEKCEKHSPNSKIYNLQPWLHLDLAPKVDSALEEILCLLLKEHVDSWFKDISNDESFNQELRHSLRYLLATLFRRLKNVDLVKLVLGPVTQAGLEHLGSYLQVNINDVKVEQAVLTKFGSHTAVSSRANEIIYLRKLADTLLPYVLPKKQLKCQNAATLVRELLCTSVLLPIMDILADPDVINHLLVIFFDKTPMIYYPKSSETPVEFLGKFVKPDPAAPHPSSVSSGRIDQLKLQELLYTFMQFLKEEGSVNILHFCLTVDEFTQKLLNPDLSEWELIELHTEAFHIYDNYMAPHAQDKILFDEEIVNEMKEIVEGPPNDVVKLQHTFTLFKAHQYAYSQMENTLCPLFHQSDRYFGLITGGKLGDSQQAAKPEKKSDKHKSKAHLKESYLKQTMEEQDEESHSLLEDIIFKDQPFFNDGYKVEEDPRLKSLGAWRVFIPNVETRMDSSCRYYHTFVIDVQRLDVGPNDRPDDFHWTVERKYHEFYVLESKLIEFHQELPDIHLPPKKTLGKKGKQFLESKRPEFEQFLQRLLAVPSLQSSELLFMFLKSPTQFPVSSFITDIKLGRIIKNVPKRLLKEKGQHLNTFLHAFVGSTEASKPKPGKGFHSESPETPKLENTLYNGARPINQDTNTKVAPSPVTFDNLYEVILFLAIKVYQIPNHWIQLICIFDPILGPTLQNYVESFLKEKLEQAFRPQRVVQLIKLLQEVLFLDKESLPRSPREKSERARNTFTQISSFFPDLLVKAIGKDSHENGTKLLFNLLQYPLLNKQLSYILLDIAVQHLFPEASWEVNMGPTL